MLPLKPLYEAPIPTPSSSIPETRAFIAGVFIVKTDKIFVSGKLIMSFPTHHFLLFYSWGMLAHCKQLLECLRCALWIMTHCQIAKSSTRFVKHVYHERDLYSRALGYNDMQAKKQTNEPMSPLG